MFKSELKHCAGGWGLNAALRIGLQ